MCFFSSKHRTEQPVFALWQSKSADNRGGHTGLFLEIPYETLESGGLLNVEKDRKKIGYPSLKEK